MEKYKMIKTSKKYHGHVAMRSVILSLIISFVLFLPCISNNSYARVTGLCSDCHTMHNSQGGNWDDVQPTWEDGGPRSALICDTCVGCHTGTNDGSDTAPLYVYTPGLNKDEFGAKTLAGGNFCWVDQDDQNGHNIFPENGDEVLKDGAPGNIEGVFVTCFTNSCHKNLNLPFSGSSSELDGNYSCKSCHLYPKHHADDTSTKLVNSKEQGWYRFLSGGHNVEQGVEGIEHENWNYGATSSSHNEYLGNVSNGGYGFDLGNTTTAFCTGCHGLFHADQIDDGEEDTNLWIRHPSDWIIPNSGEYEAAFGGIYDPNVPIARPNFNGWTKSSSSVTPGTDMVMCLSCHVAHGSPYPDMLRWDYDDMIAGGEETGGCFKCHTEKN